MLRNSNRYVADEIDLRFFSFNKITQNLFVFICLISQIRVPIKNKNSISIQSNQFPIKKLFLRAFKWAIDIVHITIMYFQFISTMKL